MASFIIGCYASRANRAINCFYNIKTKIALINRDIWFNDQCLNNGVIPNYVTIKTMHHSRAAFKASESARVKWVKNEIKFLHAKKQTLYEKVYRLHLEIANNQYESKSQHNLEKFKYELGIKLRHKQCTLVNKLERLINNKFEINKTTGQIGRLGTHEFYVRTKNLTNVDFNNNEIRVLDKGLKYNIDDSYKNIRNMRQSIVDSERAIALLEPGEKNHARHLVVEQLNKITNFHAKSINRINKRS